MHHWSHPDYQGAERDTDHRWKMIKGALADSGSRSVLDVGCAEGWFVRRAAADLGCLAVGVEQNMRPLRSAELDRIIMGRRGYAVIRTTLAPSMIERLPTFDATLCLSVVHHVINAGGLQDGVEFMAALREITRRRLVFEMGAPKLPEFADSRGRAHSADTQQPHIIQLLGAAGYGNIRILGRTRGYKGRFQRDMFAADPA